MKRIQKTLTLALFLTACSKNETNKDFVGEWTFLSYECADGKEPTNGSVKAGTVAFSEDNKTAQLLLVAQADGSTSTEDDEGEYRTDGDVLVQKNEDREQRSKFSFSSDKTEVTLTETGDLKDNGCAAGVPIVVKLRKIGGGGKDQESSSGANVNAGAGAQIPSGAHFQDSFEFTEDGELKLPEGEDGATSLLLNDLLQHANK